MADLYKCSSCGHLIAANARFCTGCRTPGPIARHPNSWRTSEPQWAIDAMLAAEHPAHAAAVNPTPRDATRVRESTGISQRTALSALVLLLILAGGWWTISAWEASPSFTLYEFCQAVKQRDADAAAVFIDFDELTHSMIRQASAAGASAEAPKSGESSDSAAEALGESIGRGLLSLMEPAISARLKDGFKQWILTDSEPISPGRVNAVLLHAIMHLQNNGNTAVSEVPSKDGKDMRFHMTREVGGGWRITSIDIPPEELRNLSKAD